MRYYCNCCHSEFEEPEKRCELHTELDEGNLFEDYFVCPSCGGEDYVEEEWCDCCRQYKPETELMAGKEICSECRTWIVDKLNEVFSDATGQFDMDYLDAKRLVIEVCEELY